MPRLSGRLILLAQRALRSALQVTISSALI
jgi:hypothetical protein